MTLSKTAGDLSDLARLLLTFPRDRRAQVALDVMKHAAEANAHRLRTGKVHPRWGCGSVMAVARNYGVKLPPEPDYDDADYCLCTMTALEAFIHANLQPVALAAE